MLGLSPRVRGNPQGNVVDGLLRGSIPASAGEPQGCICGSGIHGVYPRECGGTPWQGILTIDNYYADPLAVFDQIYPVGIYYFLGDSPSVLISCSLTAPGSRQVMTIDPRPSS